MSDQEVDSLVSELEAAPQRFNWHERIQISEARQKITDRDELSFDEIYDLRELAERL